MVLKKSIIVLVILLLAVSIVGCSSEVSTKPPQTSKPTPTPLPDPKNVIEKFVFCYNTVNSECLYELLSNSLKEKNTDDDIYNQLYPLRQAFKIVKYKITSKSVSDEKASVNVDIKWSVGGVARETNQYTFKLVLESGKWRINEVTPDEKMPFEQ